MTTIEVLFTLPETIRIGLANGTYERIGGVIRHTNSKQVVMWLQEGGRAASNPDTATGLLASVFQSSSMNAVTMRAMLGGALTTLNLALSGYTLLHMIERVRKLEQHIETMHERVSEEFARDRRVAFEGALARAHDVVKAETESFKQQAAHDAIDQLYKARRHQLDDFDSMLDKATDFEELQQAQDYLHQAMLIDEMRTRCYLQINEARLARSNLTEALNEYHSRTQEFIRLWLGKHPARYFHEDVEESDFERFLTIEAWLRGTDDVLPDLVRDYRKDFWNRDAIKSPTRLTLTNINLRLINRGEETQKSQEPMHLTALTQAELLIENFQRLRGYRLELASKRLRFDQLDTYMPNLETHDDYVLLVDTDALDAINGLAL